MGPRETGIIRQKGRNGDTWNTTEIDTVSLVRHLYELEAENASLRKSEERARKSQFRITGVFLLIFGAVVAVIAYPSYNYSTISNVLMMVGVSAMFLGAVAVFINTERFVTQKIAERFSLSTIVVLDDQLRDLRLKNKGVYVPASRTHTGTKIFVPLRRDYKIPAPAQLEGDRAFLIGLTDTAQEGVLMQPLGYHLFRYTKDDLKFAWGKTGVVGVVEGQQESKPLSHSDSFGSKLQKVFVKGLEIADSVAVSNNDGELHVTLQNTSYFSACRSIMEQAPLVCKQLGCPLCSLIACIYTEYTDREVTIESVQRINRDITVTCKIREWVAPTE